MRNLISEHFQAGKYKKNQAINEKLFQKFSQTII